MDTQPLNHEPAPTPAEEKPRRRWCSIEAGDTGMWVAIWVAIFVPMMFTTTNMDGPEDLLWAVIIIGSVLAVGAGLLRLFKNRA